jgi:hypothetical protein
MSVYNCLCREVKDFYMSKNIEINTKADYEVVCNTILDKYPRLKKVIKQYCAIENAAPKNGSVKHKQAHVSFSFNIFVIN